MSKLIQTILALAVLLLIFGCITYSPENSFIINKEFKISVSQTFTSNEDYVKLTLLEITDSRCPSGVVCIWEGELGALINVKKFNNAAYETVLFDENVNLGLVTRKTANLFDDTYSVTLASVDSSNGQVLLNVNKVSGSSEEEWFSISPRQCQSNAWDTWATQTGIMIKKSPQMSMDEALIPIWLKEKYGVNVYQTKSRITSEVVCLACSCPTGEEVAVLVESTQKSLLNSLGFSSFGLIACTEEAKVCWDGSAVGRIAPFCEFEKCPLNDVNVVDENVFIVVTKVPGFVMSPITEIITLQKSYFSIEKSVRTWDENTQDWNEIISYRDGNIDESDFIELVMFVEESNFFSLNENDVVMCIADIPTTNVEITIENKSNAVYNIGAECDMNKTKDVYSIIQLVDNIIGVES